jgi:serine phosphatase RsbU (regulator of sigma subunit)/DNA-binding GntR family transcriptional regulator
MPALDQRCKHKGAREQDPRRTTPAWRSHLAAELFSGRYYTGQVLEVANFAQRYRLGEDSLLSVLKEFQMLGIISFSGRSVIFHSTDPKDMQEAYEVRAALEEVAGRTAAAVFKGNTTVLQQELNAMRLTFNDFDLDDFACHAAEFHRSILQASGNDVLSRAWNSLSADLRCRWAIGKLATHLPDLIEAHQPIVDALEKGSGTESGLLLRNYCDTILALLKKAESESGFRRAVSKDLENATEIHRAFLPQEDPSIPGLTCESFYRPAHYIGGDYYDFVPLQDDRWGIATGDVCGKGIGAALLMASLQASLRAQATHAISDICAVVAEVDRLILAASPKHVYATLFYGEFHTRSLALRYVNAGHNSPMVLRKEGRRCNVFSLAPTGPPLGLLEGSRFEPRTFQLQQDDLFVAYTDGITDWENAGGEFWGGDRLENTLRTLCDLTPRQVVQRIIEEVSAFAKGGSQRDDATLMVARVDRDRMHRV